MLLDGFGDGAMRALAGTGRLLLPFVEVDVVALLADAADEYDNAPGVLDGAENGDFGAFPTTL